MLYSRFRLKIFVGSLLCASSVFAASFKPDHHPKTEKIEWPTELSDAEKEGLLRQIEILKKPRRSKKKYDRRELLFVARCILKKEKVCQQGALFDHVRPLRLNPENNRGTIQFTGYFTPQIDVKRQKTDEFRYPIYRKPKEWHVGNGPHGTREEIENGLLDGRGLEIAWTKQPLAIFNMQTQGSGMVKFEDGSERLLAYDGKNGHSYTGIGKLLVDDGHLSSRDLTFESIETFFEENPEHIENYLYQNRAYAFFKPKGRAPLGASGVALTAGHSIAVDPKIIPYGSVLIGKVPILDSKHRLVRHEWRLLFAQDSGGAVEGSGHVDLFTGIGESAKELASHLSHRGELWLLLKKKNA